MNRSDDDLFRWWKATPAPPDLGERILAVARQGGMAPRRRLTDRLWESQGLRYGWLAAASALLALNLWVSAAPTGEATDLVVRARPEVDPVLASLIDKHQLARFTMANRDRLLKELLGEPETASANWMDKGENS